MSFSPTWVYDRVRQTFNFKGCDFRNEADNQWHITGPGFMVEIIENQNVLTVKPSLVFTTKPDVTIREFLESLNATSGEGFLSCLNFVRVKLAETAHQHLKFRFEEVLNFLEARELPTTGNLLYLCEESTNKQIPPKSLVQGMLDGAWVVEPTHQSLSLLQKGVSVGYLAISFRESPRNLDDPVIVERCVGTFDIPGLITGSNFVLKSSGKPQTANEARLAITTSAVAHILRRFRVQRPGRY